MSNGIYTWFVYSGFVYCCFIYSKFVYYCFIYFPNYYFKQCENVENPCKIVQNTDKLLQ